MRDHVYHIYYLSDKGWVAVEAFPDKEASTNYAQQIVIRFDDIQDEVIEEIISQQVGQRVRLLKKEG